MLTIIKGLFTLGVFAALAGLFAFVANDWKAPWAEEPTHGADWCEAHQEPLRDALSRGGLEGGVLRRTDRPA